MVRPAIASSRVAVTDDGQVRITLKQSYRDGTTAVVIPPRDFVLRLLAQVSLPKRKLINYFGVFASNAKLRSAVVPAGAKPTFKRKKPSVHDPVNTAELSEAAQRKAANVLRLPRRLDAASRYSAAGGVPGGWPQASIPARRLDLQGLWRQAGDRGGDP